MLQPPIKAQTNMDQLSACASRDPSDLPASSVSSATSKLSACVNAAPGAFGPSCTLLLAPVLGFLTVPSQSAMHRGNPETETSCPSGLPLSTGDMATLGLQSLFLSDDLNFQRRVHGGQEVST